MFSYPRKHPMSTERQNEARRRNARKSTGPRTESGKRVVSQNARRHGLCVAGATLRAECPSEFASLLAAYKRDWRPRTQTAHDLVEDLAEARLRLTRLRRIATTLQDQHTPALPSTATRADADDALASGFRDAREHLDRTERYRVAAERSYHRALRALRDLPRDEFLPLGHDEPVDLVPDHLVSPARVLLDGWVDRPVPGEEPEDRPYRFVIFSKDVDAPITEPTRTDIFGPGVYLQGLAVPKGQEPPPDTIPWEEYKKTLK